MAQLPPKVPNFPLNFSQQKVPSMGPFFAPATESSFADEFLDFSTEKHGSHRRSVSDSFAFLGEFDRIDDDQLTSMFCDDVSPNATSGMMSSSDPSSPSDHNSIGKERITVFNDLEALSESKLEPQDLMVDPKRVKRILANRQSAQRSRVRKLHYISDLEQHVTTLQTELAALSPRVAFLDQQRSVLIAGNNHLRQRIAALAQDKIFKDAHQEALEKEIERLRQLYHHQNLDKMNISTSRAHTLHINKELIS